MQYILLTGLQGRRLVIRWGKSQGKQGVPGAVASETGTRFDPVPGLPRALPHPEELEHNFFNLPAGNAYPSAYPQYSSSYPVVNPPPPNPTPNQLVPPPPGFLSDGKPGIHYPSQDPTRLGAINKVKQTQV